MNVFSILMFWVLLDPSTTALIEEMDDEECVVREVAQQKLEKLGERALLQVKLAAKCHKSLEVRRRAAKVERKFYGILRPTLKVSKMPQIDMLPEDYPERLQIISDYTSSQNTSLFEGDWVGYRYATGCFARDLYDKHGKTVKEITDILDKMVKCEREWWKKNAHWCIPPNYHKPEGY